MSAMPRKRRLAVKASSVAMGHNRTHAAQQTAYLLDHLVCARQERHPFTAAQRESASTAVNSMVNVTTTIVVACKSCVLQTWPEASATSPWGPVRAASAKLSATAR